MVNELGVGKSKIGELDVSEMRNTRIFQLI